MLLANARLPHGPGATSLVDVAIARGRIAAIAPAAGRPGHDLAGALLLPALVDGHVHLDKTLWGQPWHPHSGAATVRERIEHERLHRAALPPVAERGAALLRRMIACGTTALRTHTDIDDAHGLANFHATMDLVQRFKGQADIQVVAFPQSGILTRPGVADLLAEALRQGADLVGGLDPAAIDGDAKGHLDVVFGLAQRFDRGIDIHLHDRDAAGNAQLRDIAARTIAIGMQHRVTVSHAFSLGTDDADDFARTADALAEAGVHILTSSPSFGIVPPVKALRARGVVIHAGSDNIRDLWNPLGTGDMLERALIIALKQGFRSDPDIAVTLSLCSDAAALGLPAHRLVVGAAADLVAVEAETPTEAVALRPPRKLVMKAGTILARDGAYCGPTP
jgi:cytosine deaminase